MTKNISGLNPHPKLKTDQNHDRLPEEIPILSTAYSISNDLRDGKDFESLT